MSQFIFGIAFKVTMKWISERLILNRNYIHDSTYYFFVMYLHNSEELCDYFEMEQYLLKTI